MTNTAPKVPSYVPAHLRDRYTSVVINSKLDRGASGAWIGDDWLRNFRRANRESIEYAMKLAAIRRGIANFVRIMTKRDVLVQFSSGQISKASVDERGRERIVISATNDPTKFDANVGTALHESAHLMLSKRNPGIAESIPLYDWIPYIKDYGHIFIPADIRTLASKIKRDLKIRSDLKMIINVLEDRRIDNWMYEHALGYRSYYDAFYAAHWNRPLISKALVHPLGRRTIWNCYELHFINMTNPLWDADALPGLDEIAEIVDLKSIRRFGHDERWNYWNPVYVKLVDSGVSEFDPSDVPDMIQTAINVLRVMYANSEIPEKMIMSFPAPQQNDLSQHFNDNEPAPIVDVAKDGTAEAEAIPEEEIDERGQVPMNPYEEEAEDAGSEESDEDNYDSNDNMDEEDESESEKSDNRSEREQESDDKSEREDDESDYNDDDDRDIDDEEGEGENFFNDDEDDDEWDEEDEDEFGASGDEDEDESEGDDKDVKSAVEDEKEEEEPEIEEIGDSEDFDKVLEKALDDQEKALDGEQKKQAISKNQEQAIKAVEESGAEMREVGRGTGMKIKLVVFSRLSDNLINSEGFGFSQTHGSHASIYDPNIKAIDEGERFGDILAHKLQVMAEETTVLFGHKREGRIDKRAMAGLGFGREDVFVQSEVELHKPVVLHLSLDASGSMVGEKWHKTMVLAVALARAATKLPKLDVVISARGSKGWDAQLAFLFDSRVDKFSKVKQFFPYIGPFGGTPEGLCYEAIQEIMLNTDKSKRHFFVNLSDGMPAFMVPVPKEVPHTDASGNVTPYLTYDYLNYEGEVAVKHTADQVRLMRESGITVLSYFVSEWTPDKETMEDFRAMYGKDASFVDTANVTLIASTLNKMFLEG